MGTLAYTIDATCAALGVGRTTVYRLLGEERLQAKKVGRRTIVTAASVEQFLASLPAMPKRQAQ